MQLDLGQKIRELRHRDERTQKSELHLGQSGCINQWSISAMEDVEWHNPILETFI